MKKRVMFFVLTIFILVLFILFLSWYKNNYIQSTVKNGTYYMEVDTQKSIAPFVMINDNQISFTYDFLSNHLSHGNYLIEGNLLTMTTDDGKEIYVFKIEWR